MRGRYRTALHRFDFLRKTIDTGFRIAKHSSYDCCTVSVQLAYVLALAHNHRLFMQRIEFAGRDELKGVNNGTPYPKLYIDTETRAERITLREREDALTGRSSPRNQALVDFLVEFIKMLGEPDDRPAET